MEQKPHKCPVCVGTGMNDGLSDCHACKGTGVVWGLAEPGPERPEYLPSFFPPIWMREPLPPMHPGYYDWTITCNGVQC